MTRMMGRSQPVSYPAPVRTTFQIIGSLASLASPHVQAGGPGRPQKPLPWG